MFVASLGDGFPCAIDRLMRVEVNAAFQMFPQVIAELPLTDHVGRRIFGNAMNSPVVGSMLVVEVPLSH
eukprot:8565224-Lingulodinium_polyedra.AAC.1